MSAIIGGKTCGGCKHFGRKGAPLDPECRAHPPETRILLVGVDQQRRPIIHREAGYALVHENLEACGEYVPRLATELN